MASGFPSDFLLSLTLIPFLLTGARRVKDVAGDWVETLSL